jgi:hypothetical protein
MGVYDKNYECEGQMELVDFLESLQQQNYKRKPLIYHMGLSRYYYQCPYCKAENSEAYDTDGCYCNSCKKYFDGVTERKSKELIECEKQLGPGGGAVYKDDKGKWHYSEIMKNNECKK